MPAASSRPYLPSFRSMSWMISPIAASAGSSRPASASSTSKVQRSPRWVYSPSNMSKRSSPGCGCVARARHELEARAVVDEAADQPGRSDAVDLHALPRHPYATLQSGWRVCRARPGVRSFCHGLVLLLQAGFQARYQALRRFALVGAEEVDGDDGVELLAQPRRLAGDLGQRVVGQVVAEAARHLARLGRDAPVVLVTRRIEQRLQLAIGQPVDQGRLADDRLAAALDDLLGEPGEVLARLGIGRQRVDGALHRDRAQRLQPPPDLHPRIGGLGRQLMDQQQPARALQGSLVVIVHPYHTTYRNCNICIFFPCIPLKHSYVAHETSVSKERNRCLSAPILSRNTPFASPPRGRGPAGFGCGLPSWPPSPFGVNAGGRVSTSPPWTTARWPMSVSAAPNSAASAPSRPGNSDPLSGAFTCNTTLPPCSAVPGRSTASRRA